MTDDRNNETKAYWVWLKDGRKIDLPNVLNYCIRTNIETNEKEHAFWTKDGSEIIFKAEEIEHVLVKLT